MRIFAKEEKKNANISEQKNPDFAIGISHPGQRSACNAGSGKLMVLLNDAEVGEVIVENGVQTADVICAPAGEYELKLRVKMADSLEILEVAPE